MSLSYFVGSLFDQEMQSFGKEPVYNTAKSTERKGSSYLIIIDFPEYVFSLFLNLSMVFLFFKAILSS